MNSLHQALSHETELFIRQKKHWGEILMNFEGRNRYEILDQHKNQIGLLAETGSGIMRFISRYLLRSHRGFEISVLNPDQSLHLTFKRKFFFFFSDIYVFDANHQSLGSVHRRFGFIHKKYDLKDQRGSVFATVKSAIWRLWSFPITPVMQFEKTGDAGIYKKWGGALREIFTDSDTYRIAFGNISWTPAQKNVILACGISIDFDFFEDNQNQ